MIKKEYNKVTILLNFKMTLFTQYSSPKKKKTVELNIILVSTYLIKHNSL